VRTHWETTTNFMGFHPIPRFQAYLGASKPQVRICKSHHYQGNQKAKMIRTKMIEEPIFVPITDSTDFSGSLPCLRPAHHIDSKGLRSGIDLRRIPRKMLETPASHKEEPDAWILSVSKPGLHYQNSG
jgi:hypothetical protein